MQFRVVLKIVKPLAGLAITSRSVVVIRGKSIPWLLLTTSNAALALGLLVPIPICALLETVVSRKAKIISNGYFFISLNLLYVI
jgi:hypothetical protein